MIRRLIAFPLLLLFLSAGYAAPPQGVRSKPTPACECAARFGPKHGCLCPRCGCVPEGKAAPGRMPELEHRPADDPPPSRQDKPVPVAPDPGKVIAATVATVTAVEVRPTDLDAKGHVNHARHVEYLQAARWDWLERKGVPDAKLREAGCVLVVRRVEVDYKAEIGHPAPLRVLTRAEPDRDKGIVFRQEILRSDGKLAAAAVVTIVAIDPATRQPRTLPPELAEAIEGPKADAPCPRCSGKGEVPGESGGNAEGPGEWRRCRWCDGTGKAPKAAAPR